MRLSNNTSDATRRSILRGIVGTLGLTTVGSASAHEWGTVATDAHTSQPSDENDRPGEHSNTDIVGYHSLGDVGDGSTTGRASTPHYGGITEIRTHGDYAYVGVFSSDAPTPGRALVILDISDYNDAETEADLETAEPTVVSYVRNNNTTLAIMDVKPSDDGQYVFLGTQPYAALFTEDQNGEAADPTPNFDDHSFTASKGGVVAIDVSDKGNPERVGALETFSTGIHNLFHHRIGDTDYVFLAKGLGWYSGDTGVYVMEFDRSTGNLGLQNRWTLEGDDRQGEVGDNESGFAYCHDLEVQNDPVTGRPTGYVAFLNAGFHIVDLSDPEDIEHLAKFDMYQAHFTTPAPTLIDGKRVCVVSHEEPSDNWDDGLEGKRHADSSGGVFLLDTDGIYEHDGVLDLTANDRLLDSWTWLDPGDVEEEEVLFGNYILSPHNSDFARHVQPDGTEEYWLHQAHYHGGVRFLKLDTHTWTFEEQGFSRPEKGVPRSSRMQGLSEVTPFVWAAVESNGVTFASDINQGVHAIKHDDVPVGGGPPVAGASRSDQASLFTGGMTKQVEITLEYLERTDAVRLRDRIPTEWTVQDGDTNETYEAGGSRMVEFDAEATANDTFVYYAGAPEGADATAGYTFGPVEISADGGRTWRALPETIDTDVVAGPSTARSSLVLGTAAGAVGFTYHQRERIEEKLSDLLDQTE